MAESLGAIAVCGHAACRRRFLSPSNRVRGGVLTEGVARVSQPWGDMKGTKKAQPFFLSVEPNGIGVYRRPVGNLAVPRRCGVLPDRTTAEAFARMLRRAEGA